MKPKAFGLRTFGDPRCPLDLSGAFRDNIRVFLLECGDVQTYSVRGMPVWCTLLVDEKTGVVVPMYTVEEVVGFSSRPSCEFCRCSGWSHHFVAKRRYHFIIPSDDDWEEALDQDALEIHTHLLHGLIHCNGFGHLILIRGRDGGSKHITGGDFMNLWDRICSSLRAREVTVEDSSRKRSMELRLLLGVAYGTTWFGRWGYKFHRGSFGVKEEAFSKAIDLIASQDLNGLIDDFEMIGRERELKRIVATYLCRASAAAHDGRARLNTVGNLVRSLLHTKWQEPMAAQPRKAVGGNNINGGWRRKRYRQFDEVAAELDSRWPVRRLRGAAEVVVDALVENGGLMTRQELRDAARRTIGDTGLLDFVLKSLGDCVIGTRVVRRTQNQSTRVLEFTVEDADAGETAVTVAGCQQQNQQVEKDVAWVYKNILLRGRAAETVLNGKHWIKTWPLRDEEDDRLRFFCRWVPAEGEMEQRTPAEIVVVAPHASVGDLRRAAETAMRDTYCVMEGFAATRVEGVGVAAAAEAEEPLFGAVESGATVWVRGVGVNVGGTRYEGGADGWTVECGCGAADDDGERMVACDICEVWQHTRCAGIDDADDVPTTFLCSRCCGAVMRHQYQAVDAVDLSP